MLSPKASVLGRRRSEGGGQAASENRPNTPDRRTYPAQRLQIGAHGKLPVYVACAIMLNLDTRSFGNASRITAAINARLAMLRTAVSPDKIIAVRARAGCPP